MSWKHATAAKKVDHVLYKQGCNQMIKGSTISSYLALMKLHLENCVLGSPLQGDTDIQQQAQLRAIKMIGART